jgi:hypothetical protein
MNKASAVISQWDRCPAIRLVAVMPRFVAEI